MKYYVTYENDINSVKKDIKAYQYFDELEPFFEDTIEEAKEQAAWSVAHGNINTAYIYGVSEAGYGDMIHCDIWLAATVGYTPKRLFLGYHVSYEEVHYDGDEKDKRDVASILYEIEHPDVYGDLSETIEDAKRRAEDAVEAADEETKFVYIYGVIGDKCGVVDFYFETKIRARYDEEEKEEKEEEEEE